MSITVTKCIMLIKLGWYVGVGYVHHNMDMLNVNSDATVS